MIKNLPNNLEINGRLGLNNTKIESLPNGLIVRGDLELLNCKNLTTFPNDLTVYGNMVFNYKKFIKDELKKQLPKVRNIIIHGLLIKYISNEKGALWELLFSFLTVYTSFLF